MHATQAATSERQEGAQKKKGILSQLSMPAVAAAILTSMTSFMLSSKLGLTGSLIGAALVSAVSTIASQLYNAMIDTSVDKIHVLSDQMQSRVFDRLDAEALPAMPRVQHNATQVLRRSFAVAMVAALLALVAYSTVVDVATQGQGIGPSLTVQAQQSVEEQDSAETDQVEKTEDEAVDEADSEQEAADSADTEKTDEPASDTVSEDKLPADAGDNQETVASTEDTEQGTDSAAEVPSTTASESPTPSTEANSSANAADMSATV